MLVILVTLTLVAVSAKAGFFSELSDVIGSVVNTTTAAVSVKDSFTGKTNNSNSSIQITPEEQAFGDSNNLLMEMRNDYSSNSMAAAEKWADKEVTLTLEFDNIINARNIMCNSHGLQNNIIITFPIIDYKQAKTLRAEQLIKVKGKLEVPTSGIMGITIQMKHAKIVG